MPQPIVYIDRSRIRDMERLDELYANIDELVAFLEEREPQLISYGFCVDEAASSMTVVAVHPDTASLEYHMEVGAEGFRRFAGLIDLESIEVFGEPSERVLEQLRRKAEDLGDAGRVRIEQYRAGFAHAALAGAG